jgi:uncharacterized MnhB-related membrane protein
MMTLSDFSQIVTWLFDFVLIIILLITAWQALTMPDLYHAVIVFIAFGLLVALAWVRLEAPDVAMAEAAVGSGLTGALLLSSLSAIRRGRISWRQQQEGGNDQ